MSTTSRPSRCAVGSPSVITMICLLAAGCRDQAAARQPQSGVDVGEVLGHAGGQLVEVEPQVNAAVPQAHRLGCRVEQLPLGHRRGERVEADHLDRVLRILGPDHGLQRDRHLLGRVVLAVPAHRAAHVDQHDRGAPGLKLGLVHHVVFVAELDGHAAALANVGVLERLVHVEIGQRVAIDVGPGVLELDGALALLLGVVPAHAIAAECLEEVAQGLVLDPPDALRA